MSIHISFTGSRKLAKVEPDPKFGSRSGQYKPGRDSFSLAGTVLRFRAGLGFSKNQICLGPELRDDYECWTFGPTSPSIPALNEISVHRSRINNLWFWSKGRKNKSGSLKCFNPDNLSGLTFYQKLKYMLDFVFKHVMY